MKIISCLIKCIVPGCTSQNTTHKLYKFSITPNLFNLWVKILTSKFPDIQIKVSSGRCQQYVCALHFEERYIDPTTGKKKRDAVPTLFTENEIKTRKPDEYISVEHVSKANPTMVFKNPFKSKDHVFDPLTDPHTDPKYISYISTLDHGYYTCDTVVLVGPNDTEWQPTPPPPRPPPPPPPPPSPPPPPPTSSSPPPPEDTLYDDEGNEGTQGAGAGTQDPEPCHFSWQKFSHICVEDHYVNNQPLNMDVIEENKVNQGKEKVDNSGENKDDDALHLDKRHEEYSCDHCKEDIIGFRYTCIECDEYDLCRACESRLEHPQHYMLRVPQPKPYDEVRSIIETIREKLKNLSSLGQFALINEIKEEIEEIDNRIDATTEAETKDKSQEEPSENRRESGDTNIETLDTITHEDDRGHEEFVFTYVDDAHIGINAFNKRKNDSASIEKAHKRTNIADTHKNNNAFIEESHLGTHDTNSYGNNRDIVNVAIQNAHIRTDHTNMHNKNRGYIEYVNAAIEDAQIGTDRTNMHERNRDLIGYVNTSIQDSHIGTVQSNIRDNDRELIGYINAAIEEAHIGTDHTNMHENNRELIEYVNASIQGTNIGTRTHQDEADLVQYINANIDAAHIGDNPKPIENINANKEVGHIEEDSEPLLYFNAYIEDDSEPVKYFHAYIEGDNERLEDFDAYIENQGTNIANTRENDSVPVKDINTKDNAHIRKDCLIRLNDDTTGNDTKIMDVDIQNVPNISEIEDDMLMSHSEEWLDESLLQTDCNYTDMQTQDSLTHEEDRGRLECNKENSTPAPVVTNEYSTAELTTRKIRNPPGPSISDVQSEIPDIALAKYFDFVKNTEKTGEKRKLSKVDAEMDAEIDQIINEIWVNQPITSTIKQKNTPSRARTKMVIPKSIETKPVRVLRKVLKKQRNS